MTKEEFEAFYPQFANFSPEVVETEYINQANDRFGDFGSDMNEARRLYVAHKLTVYCFTVIPAGTTPTPAIIAAAGKGNTSSSGTYLSSKKVGDVQVNYSAFSGSSSMTAKANTAFADLTETEYGMQLLTLIRLHQQRRYVP